MQRVCDGWELATRDRARTRRNRRIRVTVDVHDHLRFSIVRRAAGCEAGIVDLYARAAFPDRHHRYAFPLRNTAQS
jgi:hypothetical protein